MSRHTLVRSRTETTMAVRVLCPCGTSYELKDEFAGTLVRCPQCGRDNRVPALRRAVTGAVGRRLRSDLRGSGRRDRRPVPLPATLLFARQTHRLRAPVLGGVSNLDRAPEPLYRQLRPPRRL